jgi:coenzyme Q-binding protein COQ10
MVILRSCKHHASKVTAETTMHKHADKRFLPFTAEQMFDLVADVKSYPEFLPWCVATRINQSSESLLVADMVIGFKMFREKFTSRVSLERPDKIHVTYQHGPFKYLNNHWNFTNTPEGNCKIDFDVEFEFRSKILDVAIGAVFTEAVMQMVNAFEKRALKLYGS